MDANSQPIQPKCQGGGQLTTGPFPSPVSFRDSQSRVVIEGDVVRRTFTGDGAEWFRAAHQSGLLTDLVERRLLYPYQTSELDGRLVVTSQPIAVPTFPYEWSYNMLRDAALLTLEVAELAWKAGFHLRDASAFNVLFSDDGPRFIDLGSFRPGHTPYWFAFGQFGDHFLNPLVMAHASGVEAKWAWQRGLEGLSAADLRGLLGRKLVRPGLFTQVWLRAALEARNASTSVDERTRLRNQAGLPPEAIASRFGRLANLIQGLDAPPKKGWAEYQGECSYTDPQSAAKTGFVEAAARKWAGDLAIDVGANTGAYSEILSKHFRTVAAVEGDEAALDTMYLRQRSGSLSGNVRPILADILDPAGGRGVMGMERPALLSRLGNASLVSWLAVLHHLVVSSNLPLSLFAEMAASMAPNHVVEYVSPEDPMAKLLTAGRPEPPWALDVDTFEREMANRFETVDRSDISDTRRMYALTRL